MNNFLFPCDCPDCRAAARISEIVSKKGKLSKKDAEELDKLSTQITAGGGELEDESA